MGPSLPFGFFDSIVCTITEIIVLKNHEENSRNREYKAFYPLELKNLMSQINSEDRLGISFQNYLEFVS